MIGAYRSLVTFEDPSGPLDPAEWYCEIQAVSTTVADGLVSYVLRGAWHPGINPETRIIETDGRGRVWQVVGLRDPDEQGFTLEVACVETVGRG